MNRFFSTPEQIGKLAQIAESWRGTPFMPNGCVKGAGVSCQKLVGAIYIESGFLPEGFEILSGPMDWSNANKESLIGKYMDARPDFVALPFSGQAAPGDMIGIKLGGCIHHCGLVVDEAGKFIHCFRPAGVVFNNIRDATYMKRIEKIWRPIS
jgi:hypothetical protein